MKNSIKYRIGIFFLSLQICSVIYSQFIPERFFCWRPYDNHTNYKISVSINNEQLDKEEIEKRYRYKTEGWEPRSIHNVFSIVRQYEKTYGIKDSALVHIKYSTNGGPVKHWMLNSTLK